MVWNATQWPQRLRREALGGGRRSRDAHAVLDAVLELFAQAERGDEAFEQVRSVAQFLEHLQDQAIPAAPDQQRAVGRQAVSLLTAHRAKGSQWPLVVVAGVQDGLWPDLRPRPLLLGATQDRGWRERQMLEERRLFFVACTRASRALLVCAERSSVEDGPQPSPFVAHAAGPQPVVEVAGRPGRPLTPTGVVAGLRQILSDPASSPALRRAVWERLQALSSRTDEKGREVFPWAAPQNWWGHREYTRNERPWYPPEEPLPLSASAVESYVRCPRRWFLERRVKAGEVASTRMAFGTLLHLCAEAVATGGLDADEQQIAGVLDQVWTAVGYEPGWQERFEREQAQQATRRLLTWMKNTPGEFVAAESEFTVPVTLDGEETVRLTGSADRIDRVGTQLVITDVKTGRSITAKAAAEHVQLGLYRWAAELGALGIPGEAVAQLLYIREDPPAKQSELGARVLRQDAAGVAQWVVPLLESAAAGIRGQSAPARPGDHCRQCALISSCPARPEGQEVRP
jgi:RecB family exonuclease